MTTYAPTRYCPVPRCPNKTDGGRCAEHAVAQEHSRPNYSWRRLYRQAKWKWTRAQFIADHPLCEDCREAGRATATEEVHHKVKPLSEEQFFDDANLRALCQVCHARRTGRGE